MILKKMLQLCKKSKMIEIKYVGTQKFLSCGYVAMNISGIAPEWDTQDCAIALELDEDILDSYSLVQGDVENGVNNVVMQTDLLPAERLKYSLNVEGMPLQPFKLANGNIVFINMEYLAVFKGEENKTYKFHARNELPMLHVFSEGMLIGIVSPLKMDMVEMYRFAKTLMECTRASAENRFLDKGGQVSLEDMEE